MVKAIPIKNTIRNSTFIKGAIMRWIKIISVVVFLFYIGLSRMQAQTVTDIDGNVYNTVTIGTQVWMKENLKTTKYNDGTAIPNITYYGDWKALTTDAFCDYDNLPSNSTTYGRLYNWHAIDNNAATKMASNGGKMYVQQDVMYPLMPSGQP